MAGTGKRLKDKTEEKTGLVDETASFFISVMKDESLDIKDRMKAAENIIKSPVMSGASDGARNVEIRIIRDYQ